MKLIQKGITTSFINLSKRYYWKMIRKMNNASSGEKIIIIGAGPAGNYCAYLLTENGFDVNIYEEHRAIGKPVQCTGIITKELENFFSQKEIKKFLVNKAVKTKVYSKNKSAEIKLKGDLIIDRENFDKYIADKAKNAGAKYFLSRRFIGIEDDFVLIKNLKTKRTERIKTNMLIGADGPLSSVAKSAGIYGKRKFLVGIQVTAKYKNENSIEFYLEKGAFAWSVPINKNTARIGIAAKQSQNAMQIFDEFLEEKLGKKFQNKIISKQAGLIPIYDSKRKTQIKKNGLQIYLLGDAAAQVKATTGGGIIQGLTAAELLAKAISEKKNYAKLCRKNLGKELKLHLLIRKTLDKFSSKDYDYLIELAQKEHIAKILNQEQRDNATKIIFKILAKEPKAVLFIRKMIM